MSSAFDGQGLRLSFTARGAQKIVDEHDEPVAIMVDGVWVDPYGGVFSADEIDTFDGLAASNEEPDEAWLRDEEEAAARDFATDAKRDNEGARAFDGDEYMAETLRLEAARSRKAAAPCSKESVGRIRQMRTQELPQNRIFFRKV